MARTIRVLLLLEAAAFFGAALVHFGVFVHGYEHERARLPETVIGLVLLLGLTLTFVRAARTRTIALGAQAFALVGTLVGVFTIAIGVGPRTAPDLAYHVTILALLTFGLIFAGRAPKGRASGRA